MQKELRHCAGFFRSQTSLFSFTPPPHFNVVTAAKSIAQSNILNTEKGEGGIDGIQCNFIENAGKKRRLWHIFYECLKVKPKSYQRVRLRTNFLSITCLARLVGLSHVELLVLEFGSFGVQKIFSFFSFFF